MERKPYITERVYVETPVDTDGDGKKDLVAVYLRLPRNRREGERIPAIYIANPYLMTCNEDWYVLHDVDGEVQVFPEQDIREEDVRFDFDAYEAKITAGPFAERVTTGLRSMHPSMGSRSSNASRRCMNSLMKEDTPPCFAAAWAPGDPRVLRGADPGKRSWLFAP